MNINFIRFCSLLLLFFVLIFELAFVHLGQAATATVSVFPSTVTASIGQNFSIDVKIVNVFDLYGWEFKLGWNLSLLDLVNAVEGPFLKARGSTYFTYKHNATGGYLIADCTLLGMVHGVSGSGILATITFYVKNCGECPLDLYDMILLDSFEQLIPNQAVDGYGYFIYPHDVAITDVNASPLTALPGDIVNINVTAQNQGGYTEVFNVTVYANSEIVGKKSVSLDKGSSKIIPFMWNTTGFGKGDYTVSASASIVPSEVDTADNSKAANQIVTILYPGHDVAVINVEPFKTAVGQGYCTFIDVTVKNYGVFNETFDTTVQANKTAIQTQAVTLTSGNSTIIIFTWNTTSWSKGNYAINAYAWPVLGETDTTDNTHADGVVTVTIPGNVDGDFDVDIYDVVSICTAYGSKLGQLQYKPNCDINSDGKIDIYDVVIVCTHYGQKYP